MLQSCLHCSALWRGKRTSTIWRLK
jgi:hypothetical protein